MRRWGILVSVFYVLILLGIIDTVAGSLALDELSLGIGLGSMLTWNGDAFMALTGKFWVLALVAAQAMLLFVSVDTSFRRLQPRRHIAVSVATVALAVGLLTGGAVIALCAAIWGDPFAESNEDGLVLVFTVLLAWLFWSAVFYFYRRGAPDKLNSMTAWLIRGSILELLIAVPCHVVVRMRDDCSAPIATAYGIATGLAVMLLAFGPSVLFLYRKRLDEYQQRGDGSKS